MSSTDTIIGGAVGILTLKAVGGMLSSGMKSGGKSCSGGKVKMMKIKWK